jgi:hypothetical protein
MKSILKPILAAAVLAILSGCASVFTDLPYSRLDSPETMGEFKRGKVHAGIGRAANLEFATDASSRPLSIIETPEPRYDLQTFAQIDFGLLKRLDVSLREFINSPWMLGLKFQPIGSSRKEAGAGNFSLAITGAVGATTSNRSGNQSGLFGRGGYPWDSNLTTTAQDAAIIAGYRIDARWLTYSSLFKANYYAAGSIHQKASDDGTTPAYQASIGGAGSVAGWTFTLQYDIAAETDKGSPYVALEFSHVNVEWQETQRKEAHSLNGAVGIPF